MRHLLCLSLLILPVAAAPDEKPAEDPHRLKPGDAPTPYTAEEIRKACPVGRTDVMRSEKDGKVVLLTRKFTKCDEKGAEVEITANDEQGAELESRVQTSTWVDMQAHASFPESDTKITEESVEVPAGKFDCKLYVVTWQQGGKATKLTLYFAKTLAGPPVKLVKEVDGKIDSSMVLVEHKDPAKPEGKPAEGTEPGKPSGG